MINNSIKAQLGCIKISEKTGVPLDIVEELFYYKENGMEFKYRSLLKSYKEQEK